MKDFLKKDFGIIFLITLLFVCVLPVFFLNQGFLLIDTGREFYIPQQMLNGQVLYKDILNIYGPLSYQINAILFAIFGIKINTLYVFGILNSYLIIVFLYLISKEFLKKHIAVLLTIIVMYALVFPTAMYNSNLTYSMAIVYALSSLLISLFCLIKYLKAEGKNWLLYLSCFFAGVSLTNKYEFCFYPFVILYVLILVKPSGIKTILKSLCCFLIAPVISFGALFMQGLTVGDLSKAFEIIYKLINAPIIKTFYANFGGIYDSEKYWQVVKNNEIFSIFGFLPIINFILFAKLFKKLYSDKPLFVFVLASIIVSVKSFLYLNILHMGVFIFPISLICFTVLLSQLNFDKNFLKIFLIMSALIFIQEDFSSLKYKSFHLETPKGNINTYIKDGETIKFISDYVLENTKTSDKVVLLPEGAIVNFLTDRTADNQYLSLIPLNYYDVFGEENVIEHFKNNLPEVIAILPISTKEYGYTFFGKDYAQNFYEMIEENYNLETEKYYTKIFRRKNK